MKEKPKRKNLLSRIKEKVKISIRRKKPALKRKSIKEKRISSLEEQVVARAKYYTAPTVSVPVKKEMPKELPCGYIQDKIVLQTRDPWWVHAYWEITNSTQRNLTQNLGEDFQKAKKVLRVYDVSNITFDGTNAHRFFDIEITYDANNWYINVGGPGRSWCVDFGLLLPHKRFLKIIRSNTVFTPIEGPSWITDEEWMVPEEKFAQLYGLAFGLGPSSPVGKAWQERFKKEIASGVLASPGLFSVVSPVKKVPRMRGFWLVVNTELIVYGATEPDAKVTVQGQPIRLRHDGTFSLRFALPDGKQVIPVKAVSGDGIDERIITPIVTKETK